MGDMTMRVDCKFYESRTYPSGETVRMCRLDLAPEAPWRCPENCPSFKKKMSDGGWVQGSLATKPTGDEPPPLDDHAISLLDQAEDIINAAGPEVIAEVEKRRSANLPKNRRWWWPFG